MPMFVPDRVLYAAAVAHLHQGKGALDGGATLANVAACGLHQHRLPRVPCIRHDAHRCERERLAIH